MSFLNQPYDAVIFDMDGTLLDTETTYRIASFEVCAAMGFEMTDAVYGQLVGLSIEAMAVALDRAFGQTFSFDYFHTECRSSVDKRLHSHVPLKHGVSEVLGSLKGLGVPLGIATSSGRPAAMAHLATAGILDHFDTVVTRTDVVHAKPHPEPYLTAARNLGVDPTRCVAFEDSHAGVRAAHAAGMHTIMVPDLMVPDAEVAELCIAVLDTLAHAHDPLISAHGSANGSQSHLQVKSKG